MRVDAKIQARQWILNAIQNHSCVPNKDTEREIRKFVVRLQRDLNQLARSRDLYIAVNSESPEKRARAIQSLSEQPSSKIKGRGRSLRRRESEIVRLVKEQRKDANDRKVRFEHAINK